MIFKIICYSLTTAIDGSPIHSSTDTINSTNQSWIESQKTISWATDNPNLAAGECVGSKNGTLISVDCSERLNFVCEKYENSFCCTFYPLNLSVDLRKNNCALVVRHMKISAIAFKMPYLQLEQKYTPEQCLVIIDLH